MEDDVCKHVDEIVTWLCSMSCAMENQARAKRARRFGASKYSMFVVWVEFCWKVGHSERMFCVIRLFYRYDIFVAAAFGIGSAFLRDVFFELRRPLPCDVEHDVCKHVDGIETWLCSISCVMENQARAKILVYIYIYKLKR